MTETIKSQPYLIIFHLLLEKSEKALEEGSTGWADHDTAFPEPHGCKLVLKCYNSSAMQVVDLSSVLEKFKGMWVTLTDSDSVISASKSAKKAYDEAIKKGYKEPILFKVPLHDMPHMG